MSDEHHQEQEHEHEHHAVNYTAIFGVLCLCTLASIILDVSKEKLGYPALVALILGVALCKATFVLLYFMHIKFERAWKYVLLAPTAVLACALPFALAPDIAFHYYNVIVPQGAVEASEHDAGHVTPGHAPDAHAKPDDHAHPADHKAGDHKDAAHKEKEDGHKHEQGEADHKHPPAKKAHK